MRQYTNDFEYNGEKRFINGATKYINVKTSDIKWNIVKWTEKQILNMIKSKFTLTINISSSRSKFYCNMIELVKKTVKGAYKYIQKDNDIETLSSNVLINTHNKCWIYISIYETDIIDNDYGTYSNGAKLYIFGPNARKIYKKVSDYINKKYNNNYSTSNTIRCYNIIGDGRGSWSSYRNDIDARSFDTLFLNGNLEEEIKEFIKSWESKEELFTSRGLTHKTGLLIYGKPGTGKTTIAKILASEFNYNLINISSTDFEYIDTVELSEAINNEPGRHIIFIDEIDAIFKSRDEEESTENQVKRTTKLLSFLDGINSPNHSVFIATTNFYNRLDKALTRKGRFDKIIELNDLNKETAIRMCKSFSLPDEEIKEILSQSKYNKAKTEFKINPAELQADIVEKLKVINDER